MKIKAFLLSTMISTSIFSGTMGPISVPVYPKENFYVGLGVGGSFNNDKLSVTNVITERNSMVSANDSYVQGNLFLGIGHTFTNNLFLGAEANTYFPHRVVGFNFQGVTFTKLRFNAHFASNDYLGLDILPGYRVNSNLLVYGRAGLAFRDTTLNRNVTDGVDPYYFAHDDVGGRFGAGFAYALSQHFSTALDYYYTYYPMIKSLNSEYNALYEIKSNANYVGISLVYTV